MRFQHHPDQWIYLNNLRLPLAFFLEQEPDYTLPTGATHRLYIPGDRHFLYNQDSQWAGPRPWVDGDRYLAKVSEYQAAWEAGLAVQQAVALPQTVEGAIAYMSGKINALRVEKEQLGILWNDYPVQTRPLDINNLNAEVLAAQVGARQDGEIWRMGDNTNIPLSNAQLLDMAAAVRTYIKQCYMTAWQHKTAIDQLSSVAEILSYDIQQGWSQ